MDYYEVVHRRRMVRNFRDDPIEAEAVERIVTAGLQGPSAGFSQGFAFLALESPDDRDQYRDTGPGPSSRCRRCRPSWTSWRPTWRCWLVPARRSGDDGCAVSDLRPSSARYALCLQHGSVNITDVWQNLLQ